MASVDIPFDPLADYKLAADEMTTLPKSPPTSLSVAAPAVVESASVQNIYRDPAASWPPPPSGAAELDGNPYIAPVPYVSGSFLGWITSGLIAIQVAIYLLLALQSPGWYFVGLLVHVACYIMFLGTGIVFLCWTYLVYRNLIAFNIPRLTSTPWWAVASFFIPLMSFYQPRRIFHEIWRASDPDNLPPKDQSAWTWMPSTPLIDAWFVTFLVYSLLGGFSESSHTGGVRLEALAGTVSGVLAILVVLGITNRQDKLMRRLWSRSASLS